MTPPESPKKARPEIRWCGDLRTVLDEGPFDEPVAHDEGAADTAAAPTPNAA